jgi:CRISPR-associated protein Cmr6
MLGEYKTGFFFDHTTGMPVIPGSSVKGILRSAFPSTYFEKAKECLKKGEKDDATFWYEQAQNQVVFIQGLLSGLGVQNADKDTIEAIECEIFEGMYKSPWDREKSETHFPMRYRDCFFDAIITGSKDKYIFNDEYITPHKEPLKNPIPLQLLKVRPEVTFTFQFKLNNQYRVKSDDGETVVNHDYKLNKEQKLELFRSILLFMGAGAKTNTGFGHFRDTKPLVSPKKITENPEKSTQLPISSPASSSDPVSIPLAKVKRGTFVFGELVKKDGNKLFFKLLVDGYTTEESCNYPSDRFKVGEILKLTVTTIEGKMPNLKIRIGAPVKI